MADPTSRPFLVTLLATYRDYFTRADTNTFRSHYVAVLQPYKIDT